MRIGGQNRLATRRPFTTDGPGVGAAARMGTDQVQHGRQTCRVLPLLRRAANRHARHGTTVERHRLRPDIGPVWPVTESQHADAGEPVDI